MKEITFTHDGKEYVIVIDLTKRLTSTSEKKSIKGCGASFKAQFFNMTDWRKNNEHN